MNTRSFNPVNFLISMAAGWFVMSFLQSAVRSLFSRNWEGLIEGFRSIAFFHNSRATAINIAVMLALGILTNGIWYLAHRR